jgi:hypothetical protein
MPNGTEDEIYLPFVEMIEGCLNFIMGEAVEGEYFAVMSDPKNPDNPRCVIFIPKAFPMDMEAQREAYRLQRMAIKAMA